MVKIKDSSLIYKKFFGVKSLNFKIPKKVPFDWEKYLIQRSLEIDRQNKEDAQKRRDQWKRNQTKALQDYFQDQTKKRENLNPSDFNEFFLELANIQISLDDVIILNNEFKKYKFDSVESFLRDHRVYYDRLDGEYRGPVYHLDGLSRVTQFILRLFHTILIKILPDDGHRKYMFSNVFEYSIINEYELMKIICLNINSSYYLMRLIDSWLLSINEDKECFVYFLTNLGILFD